MSSCFHRLKQVNCSKFIVELHKMYLTIQLKVNIDENSHKLMRTYYLVNILRIQYGRHIIQDYKYKRIFGHVIAYINYSRFVLKTPNHQYYWEAR